MSNIDFEGLKDLVLEFEANKPKIGRAYWRAKDTWRDTKAMLKTLREDPQAEVNPHGNLHWFITYREEARAYRKRNEAIKKKIEAILAKSFKESKPKATKIEKPVKEKGCGSHCKNAGCNLK